MMIEGYRLKGYDATYEKTMFEVESHFSEDSCVLEITETNSGVTYILDVSEIERKNGRLNKNKY